MMAEKTIKKPVAPMTVEDCDAEIIKCLDLLHADPRLKKRVDPAVCREHIDRMLDCRLAIMREESGDALGD
jgi:hypothetical protein